MNIPSILNDVIGPVMRGPSSSHSAAAVRIGKISRDLMAGDLEKVEIRFDLDGSLPTTYLSQGSDMGICGGILGFDADDKRLVNYQDELRQADIRVEYHTGNYGDSHPNTYNLRLRSSREEISLVALSTGGGMIEVKNVDGLDISYRGDCHGLVVWTRGEVAPILDLLEQAGCTHTSPNGAADAPIFASRAVRFDEQLLTTLRGRGEVNRVRVIAPVLPILTTPESTVPFSSAAEMILFSKEHKVPDLADLALHYESARGGIEQSEVLGKTLGLVDILERSLREGLRGTQAENRILGFQSGNYLSHHQQGELFNLGILDKAIPYVTALMEVKSAMGVIVAAPTAGSCGGLPGTIFAVAETQNLGKEMKARGLLAGGLIGALVATRSTFAAEVCGCQAECGVSSGMIGGALVSMMGGDCSKSLSAASMALQNIFGMVCDPVGKRVEVPCLGKNILAAGNGISCANLALAGFDQVVPFDEVVVAMDSVGRSLPHELRCTGLGGLSVTPTSKRIEKDLGE